QANRLYLNDGGRFPLTGAATGNETDATWEVLLADLNRDGALDLIVGNVDQANKLYLNDGSGGFPTSGTAIGSEVEATRSLALGDLDRNGTLDLVVGNAGSQVNRVYLYDAEDGFPPTGTAIAGEARSTRHIVLADMDRDGRLDLVEGDYNTANRAFPGTGDGPFRHGTDLGNETSTTTALAVGDLDGDGALDVIAGNEGYSRVYLNGGDGSFPANGAALDVGDFTNSLALGDLDLDGDLDLIVGNIGQI